MAGSVSATKIARRCTACCNIPQSHCLRGSLPHCVLSLACYATERPAGHLRQAATEVVCWPEKVLQKALGKLQESVRLLGMARAKLLLAVLMLMDQADLPCKLGPPLGRQRLPVPVCRPCRRNRNDTKMARAVGWQVFMNQAFEITMGRA